MFKLGVIIAVALSIIISFYNLYNPRIKVKTLLILAVLMVVDLILCITIDSALIIPLTLIVLIIISFYENRQAITYNILISILCFLLFLINDAIIFVLLNKICKIDYTKTLGGILIYGFISIIAAYLNSLIVSKALNMLLKENLFSKHGKKSLVIILNIIFCFLIICASYYINKVYIGFNGNLFNIINLILIIGYMISTIGTGYFFYSSSKKELKIKLDAEEMKRLVEYSSIIDDMYLGVRKFKHDYINILSSINSYIDEKQWDELESYFKENILPTRDVVTRNDSISKLNNLKVIYLKALISSKVVKAESLGIKTYIDISEEILSINIKPVDLCRAVGILLDNAIEGAIESYDKYLWFGIIFKGNSIVIIVENSCSENVPAVFKMLEKNFSTKGKNRGLGLYNLKEILSKYSNVTHTFNVENNMFTSEIWIRSQDAIS